MQIKAWETKQQRPMLDEPRTVRIRFRKVGDLQYISHLDLQRTMHRIISRAGIPVWYTKGFNPHMKIVFSVPLSIGMQSECEMLDIRVEREISCNEIKDLLNHEVTDEMRILDVYVPSKKFSDYVWSEYQMEVGGDDISEHTAEKMNRLLTATELMAKKTTKSGEKEFNMIPLIRCFEAHYDDVSKSVKIHTILNVSTENYLNPAMLLDKLLDTCQIDKNNQDRLWYTIMRTEAFLEDGITVFR
jgi:radical SAM-linked protein